jgi:acetyl esterase/lipase
MKKIFSLVMLAGFIVLAACSKPKKKDIEPDETDASKQIELTDESYGQDERQKFNIYLPAGRNQENTPVLFFIHGGGWIGGSKNDFVSAVPTMRQLFPNHAFVLVNYRLYNPFAGTNKFPAQELDVKACIEYVLSRQQKYKISTKFALWGNSAGAHLAALYAYKHGPQSYLPKAVIEQVGPTDLLSMYDQLSSNDLKLLMVGIAGNPTTSDSLRYIESSPLRYAHAGVPPTLILHGTADDVVPHQQAVLLADKLETLGATYVYKSYTGEGHGLSGVSTQVSVEIYNFLQTHLK